MMRVLVLGGDGYLGWPTAMHLSANGHEVWAVDNYFRRNAARDLDLMPLRELPNLHERAKAWHGVSGKTVEVRIGDLRQWPFVESVFAEFEPEAVVHYAEQPSAPYSMLNREAASETLQNNLIVTLNLIYAVKERAPNAHTIKLGTMGEYGTPDIDIEEGWLEVEHKGRKQKFLYPRQAGSLYHTTKIMDTDLLWFYVRTWGLKVTDLMQGPVYGVKTEESARDQEALAPHFSYDEVFGTVLNRFCVQAVAGVPLTIYGRGGQTRGYLNIMDTVQCIRLVVEQPAASGELRILNQFTETFSVRDLADRVIAAAGAIGLKARAEQIANPRKEAEEHYYNPAHTGLPSLGLKPHYLTEDVLVDMLSDIMRNKNRIRPDKISLGVKW